MSDLQLLVEDSGLLFRAELDSAFRESSANDKFLTIRQVPGTVLDKENANGRIYSTATMREALVKAKSQGLFENKRLLCTSDGHPPTTVPEPINSSHVITNAYIEKDRVSGQNVLFCDWLILGTDNGRNLRSLIEYGVTHGTSIRGLGQFNESTRQIEKYEFLGCDGVASPSSGTYSTTPYNVAVESVFDSRNITPIVSEANKMNPHVNNAINVFKAAFFQEGAAPEITAANRSEIIGSLLMAESNLVGSNVPRDEMKPFLDMKEEILGESPRVSPSSRTVTTENVRDITNKSIRSLDNSDLALKHLEKTIIDMKVETDRAVAKARASDKLVNALAEKLKTLPDELGSIITEEFMKKHTQILQDLKTEHEASVAKLTEDGTSDKAQALAELQQKSEQLMEQTLGNTKQLVEGLLESSTETVEKVLLRSVDVVENVLNTSEKIIRGVQKEAYDVISTLEAKCKVATIVGNTVAQHFSAVRRLNKNLVETVAALNFDKSDVVRYTTKDSRIRRQFDDRKSAMRQ